MALTVEFLEWLREETERAWVDGHGAWQPGTHWTGGTDVDAIERRLGLELPADYRLFLEVLHSTATPRRVTRFRGSEPVEVNAPGFHDWDDDPDPIGRDARWVIEGIVFDVEENAHWMDSWGPRPATADARAQRVTELVREAPTLLPIFGHRFVVAGTSGVVLSIWQTDIIVYGKSIEAYLLEELRDVLGRESNSDYGEEVWDVPFWGELVS